MGLIIFIAEVYTPGFARERKKETKVSGPNSIVMITTTILCYFNDTTSKEFW